MHLMKVRIKIEVRNVCSKVIEFNQGMDHCTPGLQVNAKTILIKDMKFSKSFIFVSI